MKAVLKITKIHSAVAALILTLAGCAAGPRYTPPQTTFPVSWRSGTADAQWPALNWWTAFGDSQLNMLVHTALRNNHDLGAAFERVAQARAQARIAGAALSPSLSADAAITRQKSSNNNPNQGIREPVTVYEVGLTASYQLDLFGQNRALGEAARAGLTGSEFDRQTVALSVAAMTVTTYFQLSAFEARIEVANSTLAAARETLQLVLAQQREGRATLGDVAQQRAEVARQEAAIPPLRTAREQSRNALAVLVGNLPENFAVEANRLDQLSIPATPSGLPSSLLRHRPDVMRAEAALVAANANVRAATAALFPQIDLTARGGFASLALGQLFDPGNLLYNLGAGLTAPLFDGGRLKGELALSEARYRELVQDYQKAVLSAFQDVENALVAQENSALLVTTRRTTVEQTEEAHRIQALRYREGMADYLAVLGTQRALLTARDAELQARLDQLNAKVRVYEALGGGWSTAPASEPAQ